jgi:hypothetical protein
MNPNSSVSMNVSDSPLNKVIHVKLRVKMNLENEPGRSLLSTLVSAHVQLHASRT